MILPFQALIIYNSALIMPSQPNLKSKWLHIGHKVLLIFDLHYLILTFLYCLLFATGLNTQCNIYLTQSFWLLFHVLVSLLMLSLLSVMPSSHFLSSENLYIPAEMLPLRTFLPSFPAVAFCYTCHYVKMDYTCNLFFPPLEVYVMRAKALSSSPLFSQCLESDRHTINLNK